MENFFSKWPNWLRWLTFVPIGIIGMILGGLLASFSKIYTGMNEYGFIYNLLKYACSFFMCIYFMYQCLPKYKNLVCGIVSLIFFTLYILIIGLTISNGLFNTTTISAIIMSVIFIVSSIYLFVMHGKGVLITDEEDNGI